MPDLLTSSPGLNTSPRLGSALADVVDEAYAIGVFFLVWASRPLGLMVIGGCLPAKV